MKTDPVKYLLVAGFILLAGALSQGCRNSASAPVPKSAAEILGNPDYPAIGPTVYNDYATTEIVVAGGKGPYAAVLYDDPAIPNDGPFPLGASVPPGSTSINGAPVQVGPAGGGPPSVIINNNTGQNFAAEQPRFDGRNWIVSIVAENIRQGGSLRKIRK